MEAVVEYVLDEYPRDARLVEVGVGRRDATARRLAQRGYDVTATDVRDVRDDVTGEVLFVRDDVTEPDPSVYEGASLVYSLRPPYEIQSSLRDVAQSAGADLLVAPLAEETPSYGALVNEGGRALFVSRS